MNSDNNILVDRVRRDLESRNEVITELYSDDQLIASIKSYTMKNGGQERDAKDLFVFAIMTFIKQCYRPHFELSNNVNSYLFSIAKYEWIRICKAKRKITLEENVKVKGEESSIEDYLIGEERKDQLKKSMLSLDDKCRKVLTLWSSSLKMREIATRMEYKSEGMARKKKHECLNKLKLLIKDI